MTTEIVLNYNENNKTTLEFDASKVLYGFSFGNTEKELEDSGKTLHITFKPENMEDRSKIFNFANILSSGKINNIEYSIIKNETKINMFNAKDLVMFNNITFEFTDGAMNHDINSTNWDVIEDQYTSKFILYFN